MNVKFFPVLNSWKTDLIVVGRDYGEKLNSLVIVHPANPPTDKVGGFFFCVKFYERLLINLDQLCQSYIFSSLSLL